jgi:hypothetical protein
MATRQSQSDDGDARFHFAAAPADGGGVDVDFGGALFALATQLQQHHDDKCCAGMGSREFSSASVGVISKYHQRKMRPTMRKAGDEPPPAPEVAVMADRDFEACFCGGAAPPTTAGPVVAAAGPCWSVQTNLYRLEHMRARPQYCKTLQRWFRQLSFPYTNGVRPLDAGAGARPPSAAPGAGGNMGVTGGFLRGHLISDPSTPRVLIVLSGVVPPTEGDGGAPASAAALPGGGAAALSSCFVEWEKMLRTEYVDVNSKGHPCKERLLDTLAKDAVALSDDGAAAWAKGVLHAMVAAGVVPAMTEHFDADGGATRAGHEAELLREYAAPAGGGGGASPSKGKKGGKSAPHRPSDVRPLFTEFHAVLTTGAAWK